MKNEKGGRPKSEAELLELISASLPKPGRDVLTGIGDDCAVIRPSAAKGIVQLLKTDALVEGIHFASGTRLDLVGWKALCRPLSDIAAMGGTPRQAVITVAAPASWKGSHWKALYRGIGKSARAFGVSVVGGETVRSPGPCFLSVTLTGEVEKNHLKLRSGAHPGDFICVTGRLGGSLKSGRHLRFSPRLDEGRWLGAERGVTAMMDLSDGLGSDLPKLALESGHSFSIDPESLPCHRGCSSREALSDGEDYELLLTISPSQWPSIMGRWRRRFPRIPLTCIGRMTPADFPPTPLPSGYDHLRSSKETPLP
jgi:thiamine-monophosphate kinase